MSNSETNGAPDESKSDNVECMENAIIKKLRIEREQIKVSLKRFIVFLDKFSIDKIENLEVRLKSVEGSLLREFNEIQSNLELRDPDEMQLTERDDFEELYFASVGKAIKLIREYYEKKNTVNASETQSMTNQPQIAHQSASASMSHSKGFPSIELIKFYGEYEKWSQFRDLYKTLVHNDESIDKVRKFYYLLSSIKGDAAKILESIEITDQNYDLAWNLLTERYENKTLTIKNHVKALFDLPTVSKDKYSLRNLVDDFQKRFRALKLLGEPVDSWSTLLIYLLTSKLDFKTVTQWEEFVINNKISNQELKDLLNFLSDRCKLFETSDIQFKKEKKDINIKPFLRDRDLNNDKRKHQVYTVQQKTAQNAKYNIECIFCQGKHYIYHCEKFTNLSIASRIEEIKKLKLCFNCLRSNHSYGDCISQGCKVCNKRHNTLLHEDAIPQNIENTNPTGEPGQISRKSTLSVNHSAKNVEEVLLSTALILIKDNDGNWQHCRALLDSGSQSNFITRELAESLKLPFCKTNIPITGIGESSKNISHHVLSKIKSLDNSYITDADFLVLDRITDKLPSQTFNKSIVNLPDNVVLADQTFNVSKTVDLLLGVSIFYQVLGTVKQELGPQLPILYQTSFGWILSGPISLYKKNPSIVSNLTTVMQSSLQEQIQKFWEVEEYPIQTFLTDAERECDAIFTKTLKRDTDGHFIVTLPIFPNSEKLGSSLHSAVKRLYSIERKFKKYPEFEQRYCEFMNEYEQLVNESSTTTKLRVVFDGSCPTTTGISLNNILMIGPTIQDELFSILVRFRQHTIVITADVAKMYRQVKVSEEQLDLQRIVWRDNPNDEISHFQLATVTYGTASASFLATRALQQAAIENQEIFPESCKVVLSDFYVDDLLTGENDVPGAIKLKSEISQILEKYGFELRKWVSNNPMVLGQKPIENDINDDDKYYVHETRAPHHGGLWESAVKRAKYHVIRVIGKSSLTFEGLTTLFAQVEATMNSSPITPLSEDPLDYSCLTPGHFLIGSPLLSIPENDLTNLPSNRLNQFQELQKMFQIFWKKWSKDYLLGLQQRSKWQEDPENTLKIGSMVVVMDDNLPPLHWRLGRVTQTHTGEDGLLRVVTVRTAGGDITRVVQKLCLLPLDI
ncbi:uncharacterized protein LOC126741390 [Anthonomus grandis grandis]|uniref:uncharacterized protein LOC126741390 n=1 Tax=Anthonomus grandis grandis TaxID=2921223 RepID=UPI002164FED4|nr:uncharacterized protein LOC126741390 [Anthonomus grandis grandis]